MKPSVRNKATLCIIALSMVLTLVPAAVPAPVSGGELTIVYVGDEPKVLDAQVDPFDSAAMVSALLADELVAKDKAGNFQPYLASKWSVSKDGKEWTFTLRRDVQFQDGTPLNAEAVKFNFDRILDPKTQSGQAADMLGPIVRTEIVDPYTFRVVHGSPYAPFLDSISQGFIPIWSPTAIKKYGPDEFERHLVGSGPFILQEYHAGDRFVLGRNPKYAWAPKIYKHQGPAYLDKVTFRFVSETTTALAAFRAGETDMLIRFPPQNVSDFRGKPNFQVLTAPYTGSPVLYVMNISRPPLDDIRVRKALEHAIDQVQIVKVLYKGEAVATKGVMYPGSPCYWKGAETVYPHDVNKAKALLDEAGWKPNAQGIREKGGKTLQVTLVNAFVQDLGPIVQAQLRAVGVDAKIDQVPGPIQLERAGNGEFSTIFQHMAYSDASVLDMLYNSKNLKPGGWAWTRYKDPKLDALLDQSTVTVDQTKRCQLLVDAQKVIVNQALVLPLFGRQQIAVATQKAKDFGFGSRPNVDLWLYDAYVEKP